MNARVNMDRPFNIVAAVVPSWARLQPNLHGIILLEYFVILIKAIAE